MSDKRRRLSEMTIVTTASLTEQVATTSPSDWAYTAEGGANIVVSYAGISSPLLDGKVLRLRKRKKGGESTAGRVDLRFAEEVIEPLLGLGTVVKMAIIPVTRDFLAGLREHLREKGARPEERTAVDDIDDTLQEVVLTDDLVRGEDILAIEIKPKWGFLPNPRRLSADTVAVKSNYCRFCMHAYLKASHKGMKICEERHQVSYCPLDLYSGRHGRTMNGIHALWNEWEYTKGETNSLRLFLDGERLSPNDFSAMTRLHKFLSTSNDVPLRSATPNVVGLQQAITPILLASPLLPTLSVLQSSLDPLDIEGLEQIILEQTKCASLDKAYSSGALGSQPTTDEWISWRDNWLSTTTPTADRDLRSLVMAYLLSATLKDCSIFVRLQLVNGMGPPDVVIKAIDLDPKPLARIAKYRQLDKEIVDSFKQFLASCEGEPRRCRS